jgi:hypothetical protein
VYEHISEKREREREIRERLTTIFPLLSVENEERANLCMNRIESKGFARESSHRVGL